MYKIEKSSLALTYLFTVIKLGVLTVKRTFDVTNHLRYNIKLLNVRNYIMIICVNVAMN
jgi:hypothetical protein